MKFVKFRNVTEKESPKNSKGGAFSKKRGTNSNQAHLGLPDPSSRRRLLLEEATLLAWASWARLGELGGKLLPYFAINRGRSEGERGSTFLALLILLKLLRKIISVKKIQAEALP